MSAAFPVTAAGYPVGVAQVDRDDPGDRRPGGMQSHPQDEGLARRPGAVVEHEVAEAVGDELVVVHLETLDDVGMVAEDKIRARVDGLVGQRTAGSAAACDVYSVPQWKLTMTKSAFFSAAAMASRTF